MAKWDHFAEPYINSSAPSILLSIMTITLDLFVIKFYRKCKLTLVPLLYTCIASLDVLTAVGIIHLHVIILLRGKEFIGDRIGGVNVMISTFFKEISYRSSVFCNLLLAVSRTIMILKPFYQINIKKVKLVCILYAVPWIILFGLDAHLLYIRNGNAEDIMHNDFLVGQMVAHEISRILGPMYQYVYYGILLMLPIVVAFLIPVIIVIISCIIQVVTLRRSSQFPTSSNQRHVTITVLLMSILFVVCNSPYTCYMILGNCGLGFKNVHYHYIIIVLSAIVLPIFNAALNPVIIITRSSGMRWKFSESLQRMSRWVRQG